MKQTNERKRAPGGGRKTLSDQSRTVPRNVTMTEAQSAKFTGLGGSKFSRTVVDAAEVPVEGDAKVLLPVSLPMDLARRMDLLAELRGRTLQDVMVDALREYLDDQG